MLVRLAKRLCPELFIVRGDVDSFPVYSKLVTGSFPDQNFDVLPRRPSGAALEKRLLK